MSFSYAKCQTLLLRAVIDALARKSDFLHTLANPDHTSPRDNPYVNGLSLDILPWEGYLGLSIRLSSDEDNRYSPADWKHYELVCASFEKSGPLSAACEYTANAYKSVMKDPTRCQEIAHLIYVAGAEALLHKSVAKQLQAFGIDAPIISDRIPRSFFEFLVLDEDKVLRANYCEIIIANRATRRLLGRAV